MTLGVSRRLRCEPLRFPTYLVFAPLPSAPSAPSAALSLVLHVIADDRAEGAVSMTRPRGRRTVRAVPVTQH